MRKSLRGFISAIGFAALLAPMPAMPQSAPGLIGTWTTSGSGVTQVTIRRDGTGYQIDVHGACHPQDCRWGKQALTIYADDVSNQVGSVGMATYDKKFSITTVIVTLDAQDSSRLHVHTLTRFTDGSHRKNVARVDELDRQ